MTPQQSTCFELIKAFIDEHGFSPSYVEIASMMGLSTKSRVHEMLKALRDLGKIKFVPHRARSIEIITSRPILEKMSLAELHELVAHAQAEITVRTQGRRL